MPWARELFAGDVSGHRELEADIAESVLATVAWNARREEFDVLVARGREPRSPLDERRHRTALGYLTDPGYAAEVHEHCRGEIRSQDGRTCSR